MSQLSSDRQEELIRNSAFLLQHNEEDEHMIRELAKYLVLKRKELLLLEKFLMGDSSSEESKESDSDEEEIRMCMRYRHIMKLCRELMTAIRGFQSLSPVDGDSDGSSE